MLTSRDQCEKLARKINDNLIEEGCEECSVAHYHAGLSQTDRSRIQQQWQDGVIQLLNAMQPMIAQSGGSVFILLCSMRLLAGAIFAVVATIAFGMGIDKSDIRKSTSHTCGSAVSGSTVVTQMFCMQVGDPLLYAGEHRGLCTGTLQSLACLPAFVVPEDVMCQTLRCRNLAELAVMVDRAFRYCMSALQTSSGVSV